jgi:hypothetical protein
MAMGIDGYGSIPVNSDKRPGQRSRNGWNVDEAWSHWITDIEERQVQEFDDQDEFGQPEV